jgi:hypothetical protein
MTDIVAYRRECVSTSLHGVDWVLPYSAFPALILMAAARECLMFDNQSAPVNDPLGTACELVGRFLYHFAGVERRIDAAIAKLFELTDEAAAILTANIDFNRKLNLIETIVDEQASEKPKKWRSDATVLLNAIRRVNSPPRQIVAHSSFEPAENGSVRFTRTEAKGKLKRGEPIWTKETFEKYFGDMDRHAVKLDHLVADLKPVRSPTYFVLGF